MLFSLTLRMIKVADAMDKKPQRDLARNSWPDPRRMGKSGLCQQARPHIGDGLPGFATMDGVNPQGARRGDVPLAIIEKQHLSGLHPQACAGQFKDARIGLGDALLVAIDDQIAHFFKVVTLLLLAPGTDKAI